ncbi:Gfo/Idh/MocA family protein [Thermotalea metallivorans]|uniref:Scyllo-inositol 2-dehydrogenase (NAD(+)) n=1 Tax=Thermotalea metallivorans TaxID=520762 RepID=A0A140L4H8_9FIRM|nr:Gfo/Idh/MocA family oxidoreductase [Thermotalea metallivorans]KXG75453.1 scyllo-inositol 2-dehydrogenase (NAD(+)) [Thermotalea metallivorans]
MNSMKLGIIGAGRMGCNHIRTCKELYPQVELAGFFDSNQQRAKDVAAKCYTTAFPTVNDLLKTVDAVIVAAPTPFHCQYGLLCAEKKKHLLMEKPICQTQEEARQLIQACKDNGVILQVGHIERFNPVIKALTSVLKNEQIISLDFRRLSPFDREFFDCDVIHDLMIHDLDIMNWIVDCKIDTIYAHGKCIFSEQHIDYGQALIRFANDILVSLTASRVTEDKMRMLTIHTKNSCIYVDFLNRMITIYRRTAFKLEMEYDIHYKQENIIEKVFIQTNDPLKEEISSFVHSVKNNQIPVADGFTALKALEIADIISKLIYTKR